jgi:parvulin-like peptidyl-prolyl isomerase
MIRHRLIPIVLLASVTACDGFREAMTAHVDVAARAGSQQLSVEHLSELMGKSQIPVRKDVAQSIADIWVSYQLLAKAAAEGDSLNDPKLIDDAMWPAYTQQKTQKFYQLVSEKMVVDTSNLEAKYNEGTLLSARHILFPVPQGQAATGSDSIRRKAEGVLKTTTAANFAALAKQYGSDGTKDKGGDLGIFSPKQMVPDFTQAIQALKPGEIGPLVRTQFGYHIVRRNTYAEVKSQFGAEYARNARQAMESTYVANVEKNGNIEIKPNAAKLVKEIAANPEEYRDDNTAVATYKLGNFTAARVTKWINGFPQPEQIRMQLQQAPDSIMPLFLKNLMRNELLLAMADSAKVTLDTTDVNQVRKTFVALVSNAWTGLHVSPKQLADSAKTKTEKERLAAARVDAYLDRLVAQQEQFIEIPPPLAQALRAKYDGKVTASGIDRAVSGATKIRAAADSARAAQQPKSAVPMPSPTKPDSGKPPAGEKK